MIRLEGAEPDKTIQIEGFDSYSKEHVSFHVRLMHEAGLIVAYDLSSINDSYWVPERLTWEGYEFLESSRDDSRWAKAKTTVLEKAGGMVLRF